MRTRRRVLRVRPAACLGFTFAEVLTAILAIGIGLIGIAALYSEGLKAELDTQPRAQAAQFAQAIADRILANTAGRVGYASVVGVVCTPGANTTRPDNAAAQEAACWQDEIERKLPNGTVAITRDRSTAPATYVVAVSWSAPGAGAGSYVMRVQPKT
jgi:type IV pilus modification protein PilV